MAVSPAVHTAAEAIANAALAQVTDPPGTNRVRVEDYLTALGASTGESAIVDAGIDIESLDIAPGSALFGDQINQVLTGDTAELAKVTADSVAGILIAQLVPEVVALGDFGSIEDLYRSVAASVGQTAWGEVHLSVPEENSPRVPPIRLAFELRSAVEGACVAAGVKAGQRHQACALALAGGLAQVREAIDVKIGLRLALEVVFGMAKMAPMSRHAFEDAPDSTPKSTPKSALNIRAMSDATAATIERIDVYGYDVTYAHGDYIMSSGRVVNRLPSTVVRITTHAGAQGFGEVCPLGATYLPAFGEGARAALRELAPALIGADATNLADIHRRLDARLRGHGYAKSALDVACWDAFGRLVDKPVSALLGGALQSDLPLYVAVPLGEPEQMAAFVTRERATGMRNFQAKLGGDPTQDAQRVAAILAATGPGDAVTGDANGGWRRQDAIMAAGLLAGSERFRLEQPCPTLEECLAVRRLTTLPMVLDEVMVDLPTLVRAASLDAMDQINLKISRVGGLLPARVMRDVAVSLGIRLMIEDSWGGDIVTASVAHLAAGTPPEALFAVSFMNDWTLEHVAAYQPRSAGGRGPVPDGPGLGIEVDVTSLGNPLFTVTAGG